MATSTTFKTEEEQEEENVGIGNSVSPNAVWAAAFILVMASYSLSLATYFGCSFYSVTYYKDYFPATGAQYAEYDKMWGPWTLGVSFCKYDVFQGGRVLESAVDIAAYWAAFLAPCLGLTAFIMLICLRTGCSCQCFYCLAGTSSFATTMCAFLMACSVLQFLSLLVLASPYCGTEYNGTCQLLRDGWLSLSAAILWAVSAFAAWKIPTSDME